MYAVCCVQEEVKLLLAVMKLKTAGVPNRTDGPVHHGEREDGGDGARTEKYNNFN